MDRGTKIYALMLALIVAGLIVMFLYEPAKVRELNGRLADDTQLAGYPYQFRVLRVEDHTAVMSTPRSAEMPVHAMIHAIDHGLRNASTDDMAFQQAQKRLADFQAHARERVMEDPDIYTVSWELDKEWLRQQGIVLPQ